MLHHDSVVACVYRYDEQYPWHCSDWRWVCVRTLTLGQAAPAHSLANKGARQATCLPALVDHWPDRGLSFLCLAVVQLGLNSVL
eukprot:6474495-Amphidinium_carterae.1